MDRRRLTIIPALFAAFLAVAPCAWGQVSTLDQTTLIEGLRKEGMGELLQRLSQTEIRGDPILSRQVAINQLLIDYAAKKAQASRQADARRADSLRRAAFGDFRKAMTLRQELIKDFYQDDQRPLWQTDLAEQQLIDDLQINQDNANDFYEFGVPTTQQRDAFETLVPQALAEMSDADLRLSQEENDLPRQPDHLAKRVNTGLWDRMNQYFNLRVPYYLAHAAFYATLLPDSASYYRNLGKQGIADRMQTVAQERARLLALTIVKLDPLVKAPADPYQVRRAATCLTARALIAQGKFDQALALLDPLVKDGVDDRTNLLARLAKAQALEGSGANSGSLDVLADARSLPWVRRSVLFNLLVTDAMHRILLRRAQSAPAGHRAAAIALAYEPYRELLDDPALGSNAGSLRDFIARRWDSSMAPDQDVSNLPGMVVAAVAEIARSRGQSLMDQAATQKDGAKASQWRALGKKNLQRAISLNAELLQRKDLVPNVKAQAMFNEAVAIYYLNPHDPDRTMQCAVMLADLADQMPDQKLSEPSITDAAGLLRYLLRTSPSSAEILQAYRRAADVLMAKYPNTKAAMDERLYYAADVLAPAGELTRAVEILREIPAGHPDYFPAQCALLDCLERQYRQARKAPQPPDDVDAMAAALESEAGRIDAQTKVSQPNPGGEEGAALHRAAGWSRLVLAEMAMERRQDAGQALSILQGFDQDYANDDDLIRRMLEIRIPALFKAGRLDDAYGDALRMMKAYPDTASPVIDRLLRDFDQYVENLLHSAGQRPADRPQSGQINLARVIVGKELTLVRFMLDWGRKRKLPGEKMLPLQFLYAKALRLSGQPRTALDVLVPLLSANPNNANVILATAEAWFALGGNKNLLEKAAPLYDRLIRGIPAENGIYPAMWWIAWMRRLQVCDITGQGTDQIGLRIRQLRMRDENLGGDITRPTLEMLEKKWGQ